VDCLLRVQGTIHQVFENAVQQPTFVAMYADLCRELDAVLPEFRAPGAARMAHAAVTQALPAKPGAHRVLPWCLSHVQWIAGQCLLR
jgi:hypothetical protein